MHKAISLVVCSVTFALGASEASAQSAPFCGAQVTLTSWKGDYLTRTTASMGSAAITSGPAGASTVWTVQCQAGKVLLRSSMGDFLHRPDIAQGVHAWNTGIGNEWTLEAADDKFRLKSWKGDYLHRPDSAQGVTTWGTGVGNEWTLE